MKKLALVILLALGVIFSSATLAYAKVYGPVIRVEYRTNRTGSDIREGFPANFSSCMDNCANDSRCKAFTWVKVNQQAPNYNNDQPLCWLKNSVPGKRRDRGMVSGVKL